MIARKPAACAGRGVSYQLLLVRNAGSGVHSAALRVKRTADQVTGQADVSRAQEGVRELRDHLRERRLLLQSAEERYKEHQQKLKEHYDRKIRVYDAKKRDLSSLALIHQEELQLLEDEQQLEKVVDEGRLNERQCFEALCEAIQDSHEREREYGHRTKTFTAVASSVSAALGFLGSYLFLRREVKRKLHEFEGTLAGLGTKLEQEDMTTTLAAVEECLQSQSGLLREVLNTQHRVLNLVEKTVPPSSTHSRRTKTPRRGPQRTEMSAEADQVTVNMRVDHQEDVWVMVGISVMQFLFALFSK